MPPRADNPPLEHCFQQTFIHAVPEVGFMSEVGASGPYLRAAATAWPGNTAVMAKQTANPGNVRIGEGYEAQQQVLPEHNGSI